MSRSEKIQAYWDSFLNTVPADATYHKSTFISEQWGDTPELATELGTLITEGLKRASCSTLWEYEDAGDEIPTVGSITIVLDGSGDPLCIIETTEVSITPFHAVDAAFAYDEGEGDRSLEYWRRCHWDYFTYTLKELGKMPTEDMPLICERFRVIHRA